MSTVSPTGTADPEAPPRRLGLAVPRPRHVAILAAAFLTVGTVGLVGWELHTSTLQAWLFSRLAARFTYRVEPGASDAIRFPRGGPWDQRHGYAALPAFIDTLLAQGFVVRSQARLSPELVRLADRGIALPYREKTQAGLCLLDGSDRVLYASPYPERIFASYSDVPAIVVHALLFIENRELLATTPRRNPAVEWDRLAAAVLHMGWRWFDRDHDVPGGSTLATQMEKFRHSPDGLTTAPAEKLQQMVAASLRTYLDGELTMPARRRIVVDYLNSIPLAAAPGRGEVTGLGDGLYAWYGADLAAVSVQLRRRKHSGDEDLQAWARDFRLVLSLLLAQRRPSYFLLDEPAALERRCDTYLRMLTDVGVLTEEEGRAALALDTPLRGEAQPRPAPTPTRKMAGALRGRLLPLLGAHQLYDVDRLDLTVSTTLDWPTQRRVSEALRSLADPRGASAAGLRGDRLLQRGDPAGVIYSVTLYERTPHGDLLRVQADSYDQPLNVNEGVLLELGSSAKLRTLVTYLEVVGELYERGTAPAAGAPDAPAPQDPLSRWAVAWLASAPEPTLEAMLDAAMQRVYSANPDQEFFTGGGIHTFVNFDPEDDVKALTVRDAFRNSINLVFIRLMRDIVAYHTQRRSDAGELLGDADAPQRQAYLERFAEREGAAYVRRFYRKYSGRPPAEVLAQLFEGVWPTPERVAAAFRYVDPAAPPAALGEYLAQRLPEVRPSAAAVRTLYDRHAPEAWSLVDRGFVAHVHPLELWVAAEVYRDAAATLESLVARSAPQSRDVYTWLYRTSHRDRQDVRIRTLLEVEAFEEIGARWRRVGYPFPRLVASLATSIGSSGDRPASLAELVGVLLNDGMRVPAVRVRALQFAAGTPYETNLVRLAPRGERVLRREVAQAALAELAGVVAQGTGRRVHGVFTDAAGQPLVVGGKTGTGDNRYELFGADGKPTSSRVTSRTAVFVFHIGDRFYGAVTAYVMGKGAENYRFTSALPVQVLKHLAPSLEPLVAPKGASGVSAASSPAPAPPTP